MKRILAVIIASAYAVLSAQINVHAYAPLFEASFLQGWLCRGWTQAQWNQEFSDMHDAGFHAMILQSTVDLTYEQTNPDLPKTDPDAFVLKESSALYPTSLVPDSENTHALEFALQAAKANGMCIYIGTVSDNRWWNYGWGVPDEGFSEWSDENVTQCRTVVREVWEQFGDQYGAQIAGFYYNNEIWNMDAACAGTDHGATAAILGRNLHETIAEIEAQCPEKTLLISPFYNKDLSDSAAYGAFWKQIAVQAQLRPQDILAHQDGGGRDYDTDTLAEWSEALRSAVGGRMRFWVNQESFNPDTSAKAPELLRQNYFATATAEKHILFSWNHYYHGKDDAGFALMMQKMTGDLNGDGLCSAADAVLLSRWIGQGSAEITNWLAGDLNASGALDAADLTLLKRMLLHVAA